MSDLLRDNSERWRAEMLSVGDDNEWYVRLVDEAMSVWRERDELREKLATTEAELASARSMAHDYFDKWKLAESERDANRQSARLWRDECVRLLTEAK